MVAMQRPSKKQLGILFICAFAIRAIIFFFYIQPEQRYKQSDSMDYHNGALCIAHGFGMHRPDTGAPIFWRTPGYPLYLAFFYSTIGIHDVTFPAASTAQKASIWFQIFLNAFIPIILLLLAFTLTHSWLIAQVTAWISVFHVGMVLASTYVLTEAVSLIPFYLFLYFFYQSFENLQEQQKTTSWKKQLLYAAIFLALYAWFRPMGQFVAILSALIICICTKDTWKLKLKKSALLLLTFFACISPWYIRNYQLTGSWFFCPMFGAYLNSFCAPRIKAHVEGTKLIDAWNEVGTKAELTYRQNAPRFKKVGIALPKEFICAKIAWPIVLAHPWLALYDWVREALKTTFDLYSYQLVAFIKGCFHYDPLIEYLSEKIQECLYKTPMSWSMRAIVYLELLFMLILWVGLFGGAWLFLLRPLICSTTNKQIEQLWWLWWQVTPMIGGILFMTGGFGYARLRLPIEPLMIILSLSFWQFIYSSGNTRLAHNKKS